LRRRLGDKLVLFDTGMGSSTMFGPTTGKLLANLKAAGIDPKDIDAVVATGAGDRSRRRPPPPPPRSWAGTG
jgi:glyoxylase-like metal-dependent hydrolase (beta-lactamase superfamily II)